LKEKALQLGWNDSTVQVLDRDLGKSGAQITGREDFKTLVAEVSMGQVGAVFALEVSRLARSNLDWHRLLELCALTDTLVIDEDGCYNPADFNDGLLLGLKRTMAQAELHLLRGRLLGGKLNKARKGELRFPLPVGLCYDEEGRIVLDPDEEVRGAVELVFRLFRETGSAFAVVQQFAKQSTLSQAILRWRMGWQADMGSVVAQSSLEHTQESLVRRHVRLRPLSVSPPDQSYRRGS
jgi:DNA invertase Pin-like site-specific DNA recombinase